MSVNVGLVNAGTLYAQGLQIAYASATTLTVAAGACRNSSNLNDITLASSVTINAAVNNINGLDIGSLAASKLYAIYAVGDSTSVNTAGAVISLSTSGPLMPVGYDMYRLIGYVRTNGSSQFLLGYWSGSSNERLFTYDTPIATAVTAGAATSYTAVSLDTFVPAVVGVPVWMGYDMTPAAASRILSLHPAGATGAAVSITSQVTAVHVTGNSLVQAELVLGVPNIEYKWSAGGGDAVALTVHGYQYSI